jgi:hypothetical protein
MALIFALGPVRFIQVFIAGLVHRFVRILPRFLGFSMSAARLVFSIEEAEIRS